MLPSLGFHVPITLQSEELTQFLNGILHCEASAGRTPCSLTPIPKVHQCSRHLSTTPGPETRAQLSHRSTGSGSPSPQCTLHPHRATPRLEPKTLHLSTSLLPLSGQPENTLKGYFMICKCCMRPKCQSLMFSGGWDTAMPARCRLQLLSHYNHGRVSTGATWPTKPQTSAI